MDVSDDILVPAAVPLGETPIPIGTGQDAAVKVIDVYTQQE
jgi:hypothetical protein